MRGRRAPGLERAGTRPEELDLIIVATDTPDYLSPATSSVVQAKLGAVNAGTFDVNCACAGWVTALDVASKTIAADDSYQRILVVGAYGMSALHELEGQEDLHALRGRRGRGGAGRR